MIDLNNTMITTAKIAYYWEIADVSAFVPKLNSFHPRPKLEPRFSQLVLVVVSLESGNWFA
jgi:hypothetical protein